MRAVKSVLTMAGFLKQQNPKSAEDQLLMKAMRDANIPKFIKEDLPLFYAIINDLFPNSN
jgi:dynein heavy chain